MSRWSTYFNDNEPYVAAWLRNLYPNAVVDQGDVAQVTGLELFRRVHLFAGISGWEYALQLAGWPEDRPVWTGSCPCQPYSTAGKRKGDSDERNLWPQFFRLIRECHPDTIFGEQVESAIGHGWLDGVFRDLEGEGYTCGAAVLGAHSVGAPHIRQRLYWVADSTGDRRSERGSGQAIPVQRDSSQRAGEHTEPGVVGELSQGLEGRSADGGVAQSEGKQHNGSGSAGNGWAEPSDSGRLGNPNDTGSQGWLLRRDGTRERFTRQASLGPWGNYDLIECLDEKTRRFEPSSFPLAYGVQQALGYTGSIETQAMEEITRYAYVRQANPSEVLSMVRSHVQSWPSGQSTESRMCEQLHAQKVLLALLLGVESARESKSDSASFQKTRAQAFGELVRSVWMDLGISNASCRWQPTEQSFSEPPNSLHELSLILARHVEAYWEAAYSAHAAASRVGRIRAYGNSIVAPLAATFIRAFLDSEAELQ